MKRLVALSAESVAMENASVNLKELSRILWSASFGDYWRDLGRVNLQDGKVYAVRRVWLYPKRSVSGFTAVGRWSTTWGWQWLHGKPEDTTGRSTLSLWVKRPEAGCLQS